MAYKVGDAQKKAGQQEVNGTTTKKYIPGMASQKSTAVGYSPNKPEEGEGLPASIFRGLTEPIVKSLARPVQAVKSGIATAQGNLNPDLSVNLPFYGKIEAPEATGDVSNLNKILTSEAMRKEYGVGLKTASLGLGPVAGGGAYGAGAALEEGKSNKEALMWGAGGALLGYATDIGFKLAGKGLQKAGTTVMNSAPIKKLIQNTANKLQTSSLPLTAKQKFDNTVNLERTVKFLNDKKLYGTNAERFDKTGLIEDRAEKTLQEFLETNNTAKNVYANKGSIIQKLINLKNQLMKDNPDAAVIGKQIDSAISNIQQQYAFQKIPISRLNTLKRETYKNAFNKAGDKVLDDVEYGIGDVLRTELEKSTKGLTYFGKSLQELNKDIGDAIVAKKILKMVIDKPTIGKGLGGKISSGIIGAGLGSIGGPVGTGIGAMLGSNIGPPVEEALFGASTRSKLVQMILKSQQGVGGGLQKAGGIVGGIPKAATRLPQQAIKGTPRLGIQDYVKNYIKNPKLGMGIKDISAEKNALNETRDRLGKHLEKLLTENKGKKNSSAIKSARQAIQDNENSFKKLFESFKLGAVPQTANQVLYHGTKKRAANKIETEGFKKSVGNLFTNNYKRLVKEQEGFVSFTPEKQRALQYATKKGVILERKLKPNSTIIEYNNLPSTLKNQIKELNDFYSSGKLIKSNKSMQSIWAKVNGLLENYSKRNNIDAIDFKNSNLDDWIIHKNEVRVYNPDILIK